MAEKDNIKDLLATIAKQNDKLTRYESRLRDVVTAYKGLLKEKEALEASLAAISGSSDNIDLPKIRKHVKIEATGLQGNQFEADVNLEKDDSKHLELQLATLMNSLATLSAEKSRMEASFQADKKQLRLEKEVKDITIKDLQEKLKTSSRQTNSDVENIKARLVAERHEREKEQNDHRVMIRELQKLLSDERHLKEQLEIQMADLKTKFSSIQECTPRTMERQLRDVNSELELARRKMQHFEAVTSETSPMLMEMQNEIASMKQQHSVAIQEEQRRVAEAEDRARCLAALHEERVAAMEARLAALSNTVGTYDRLRNQDQINIQQLKDQITIMEMKAESTYVKDIEVKSEEIYDIQNVIDKILKLKQILIVENERLDKPVDISKIFNTGIDHTKCKDDYNRLMQEFYDFKLKTKNSQALDMSLEMESLKSHVKTLKDKVRVLNGQIDEMENECKEKVDEQKKLVKAERSHWKEVVSSMEMDCRSRIGQLEQQLQKQRDRSLGLLEDKELEIKTLKESFQMFLPGNMSSDEKNVNNDPGKSYSSSQLRSVLQGGPSVIAGETPHMLHYAHELARRDVEISSLRRAHHNTDSALREALRDLAQHQERYRDQEQALKEEIERLERCQSREGANLEYLKNVVLSFLLSTDSEGKSHMMNAIAAVLKFSQSELDKINKYNAGWWSAGTAQTAAVNGSKK